MDLTLRPIQETEIRAFVALGEGAFGGDLQADDDTIEERFMATLPLDRTFAGFDEGQLVSTGADFPLLATVPGGGLVPTSGLTFISVAASHRRRGILSRAMERHYALARERGEPLGGLWASEASIYSRFGYGAATDRMDLSTDARLIGLPPNPADIRIRLAAIDGDGTTSRLDQVYKAACSARPGMLSRTEAWWKHHRLYDPLALREGSSSLRCAFAEAGADDVGYVLYRVRANWNGPVSEGSVEIVELVSRTADGRRALWNHVLQIDLFPHVKYWGLAVDDPIRWEVANPRYLRTTGPTDSLWIRLILAPDALAARRYAADGRLTMSIRDDGCPWNAGAYELIVEGGEAACRPANEEPELHLDAATLGALYLGGRSAVAMGAAGRIQGPPEAITRLDTLFRWPVAPWCPEIF